MTNGGVFLKGVATEYNPEAQSLKTKTFSKLCYIPPSLSIYKIKATKTTRVFHFRSVDIINELITAEVAEKEKQRTLSISLEAGFRKASMLNPKKFEKAQPSLFIPQSDDLELRKEPSAENQAISLQIPSVNSNKAKPLEDIEEKDDL